MLKHTWESLKSIMGPGHLDPLTKELVQTNELYAMVGLANMTNRLANAYKVPVDEQFKDATWRFCHLIAVVML